MRLIILLCIFLASCSPYQRVSTFSIKAKKAKKITKKFNYTKPYQSYSDKPTKRRAWLVSGHMFHFSY